MGVKPVKLFEGIGNGGCKVGSRFAVRPACTSPVTALLILEWQVVHPVNDRYTRCRDSVDEAIHCAPSFLINLG